MSTIWPSYYQSQQQAAAQQAYQSLGGVPVSGGYGGGGGSGAIVYGDATNSSTLNLKKKGIGTRIMNSLKKYIEEHKGTLYALGAIFLIDHFLLKGALRERITKIVTSVLDKIQKTLEGV